jgi:predicted N-acetyltransferase YhbS
MQYRLMQTADLGAVAAIQREAYVPQMVESDAVMQARLAACPATCWVADDGSGACAYLFAYRSQCGKISTLGDAFSDLPSADALYLHDLAVARRVSGRGIGPALVRHALQAARQMDLPYSCLVAVQDSLRFWSALGYQAQAELSEAQRAQLASYHGAAHYMVLDLRAVALPDTALPSR